MTDSQERRASLLARMRLKGSAHSPRPHGEHDRTENIYRVECSVCGTWGESDGFESVLFPQKRCRGDGKRQT